VTDLQLTSFDVLIVGAGISGIGAAYYLQREHPQRSYAILEAREASGGTWDLFRFPGIRSDSDLHTFGYEFKPWRDEEAIADGDRILAYLREAAAEHGIDRKIRFRSMVRSASWSSQDARWTVEVEHADTGERTAMTCNWIFCAGGYYRYDEGFSPRFEGQERFRGPVVHPQHWPPDLDYAGQRVLMIGSGATAVTLIPALARTAMGGIALTVDGQPVRLADTIAYKGMMLSGVPNFAYAIGYTNSSWTLKVGLLCEHFCRLLARMDARGDDMALPVADPAMATRPLLDFAAGYVQRAVSQLPRQGDRPPWLTSLNYASDVKLLRHLPVEDPDLHLRRSQDRSPAEASA